MLKATLISSNKKQFSVLAQVPADDARYIPIEYPRGSSSIRMCLGEQVTIVYQLADGKKATRAGILRGGENRTRYELRIENLPE